VTDNEVLKVVCDSFVRSHDFNGICANSLIAACKTTWPELQSQLAQLVVARKIDLVFESVHVNPNIKRLPNLPAKEQVVCLAKESIAGIGIYPSFELLNTRPELGQYDDRPYTRRLALAEPQLVPVFFELNVLDRYFRDPRYLCHFGDRDGSISVRNEHFLSDKMAERDKVLLRTFGIGYDANRNRVVAAFLRYLSDLSAEHQQIWKAQEVSGPCTMNSDYERASIWGMRPEHYSVYEAFIQEQIEINNLSAMIGKPPLFKNTFEERKRPLEFSPMLRPTLLNFHEFAHTLDKMLSENLNREFFKGDIPLEDRETTRDGAVRVNTLATITLLQRWLSKHYNDRDGEDMSSEIVQPLRDVREERQRVAHALTEDAYDQTLPQRQDTLLGQVVVTLQKLRLILTSHPKVRGYTAPDWLDGDKIVFY
jgi:hypothetical protein